MQDSNITKELVDSTRNFLNNSLGIKDIEALREVLRFHEHRYYILDDILITDREYDLLYNRLKDLEREHPSQITPDSPTQRVAGDLNPDFPAVTHIKSMLSLGNAYNEEDLRDFHKQILKLTGAEEDVIEYMVEPKYDGGSIALLYKDDVMIRAATRGNGQQGEEMTPNARTLPSVPLKALFSKYGIVEAELRGEAVIRKDIFDKVNEVREAAGENLFANPRNAATGGLRTKNANETRKRGIEVFVFQMGHAIDNDGNDALTTLPKHSMHLEKLGAIGFKVPQKEVKKCQNIGEVIDFIKMWEGKRDSYEYEIDGMVVKVNSIALQNLCGSTQHHPRWATAFKFKAKQATTILEDVEYQVGKIGSITPVAKVKPVHLAGVTVSSVSLHNEEFISSKDLRKGDTVIIERAGDVIPYIVKSLPELRDGSQHPIEFPTHCPIGSEYEVKLQKEEGESAWRCKDCQCGSQILQRMIFHVSKNAMDIDGFGKSYVEKFHEMGWLGDLSDIYNLDYNKIEELEGFGSRSATKLKISIDKAKQNPIQKLLHSLSIHHLGKKASQLLSEQIEHVLDLREWDEDRFLSINDIGPVVAKNVAAYFSEQKNIDLLMRMENLGVNLHQTDEDKPLEVADDAPFLGKTILFTGSLQQLNRKEAQELAAKAGAKNISAVSNNLDILVVGEKAGSKLKKAEALGTVQILTEKEFIKLIGEV